MKLSEHFTLEEMTISQEAARNGLDNKPTEIIIRNLELLCGNILEPLRIAIGVPISISSGYRSPEVNKIIGGSPTSQHCFGQAADIHVNGLVPQELFNKIIELDLPFDQVIEEFEQWVHVSYREYPRKQKLIARHENGKTNYFQA